MCASHEIEFTLHVDVRRGSAFGVLTLVLCVYGVAVYLFTEHIYAD